jgi:class 3 adenylate cyclase
MMCDACRHDNPDGNVFCGGCGARLVLVCGHCGASSAPANKFCGHCGHRLAPEDDAAESEPAVERGERRQLTVLFCDLVGSTDLAARLDPEEYREGLSAYYAIGNTVLTRYGGYVAQHLGDGLLVYFGWPETYDDAAERAVRAGLELVEATATVWSGGAPLAARVGLHTGTAVVTDVGAGAHSETLAVGDTLNVAARVQSAAEPGHVFITAATHRLVSGLFIVEERGAQPLKGIPEPVELYRVVEPSGVRGRLGAAAARGFTPFVNRNEERALLRSRFERVCDGEGHVVLLTGEAGIGKSRLAEVLREEIADTPHTWLETGCSAHFANTPFHAVIELLKQRSPWEDDAPQARAAELEGVLRRAGLDPATALPLVAPLLDIPIPDAYEPIAAAPEVVRKRLLSTLARWLFGTARLQPLVILIEDLHWVDPSTLELVQLLVEQGATVPLFLLATARPQFQAPWPSRAHYTQLTLSRLPRRHVRDMVLGVAAQATLLAEVIDEVAARTDGVPLFVEELTKVVVEVGAAAAAHHIPATLADSLMARLDRLGAQAKEVAQVGAVCGREFSFGLIQAMHPLGARELEAALAKLVDAELLHVHGSPPEATYTFKHALVQDAAYESLLKSRRRALHGQVAAALTAHFPQIGAEHPELLAHHHECAAQPAPALAAWQLAGERALERGANREAERYLERGRALLASLPEGSQRDWSEFQLQLNLGAARLYSHGFSAPAAAEALARAMQLGGQLAEPMQLAALVFGRFASELSRNGPAVARPLGEQLLALAQRVDNPSLAGLAEFAVGLVAFHLGERESARTHFLLGLERYDESQPLPLPVDVSIALRTSLADLTWQLGFADQARAAMRDTIERAERSARAANLAWALHHAALLALYLREPDEVAHYSGQLLAVCAAEPTPTHDAIGKVLEGWSLAARGMADAGRELIRAGIAELVATEHRLGLESFHCLLADACASAGDLDAALRALGEGEDACPGQLSDRTLTFARRAEFLVRQGATVGEIEAAFAEALGCARRYQFKSYELRIAIGYARWLGEQGRRSEARDLLAPLYASFNEGFDTRDMREARELLDASRQPLEGLSAATGVA